MDLESSTSAASKSRNSRFCAMPSGTLHGAHFQFPWNQGQEECGCTAGNDPQSACWMLRHRSALTHRIHEVRTQRNVLERLIRRLLGLSPGVPRSVAGPRRVGETPPVQCVGRIAERATGSVLTSSELRVRDRFGSGRLSLTASVRLEVLVDGGVVARWVRHSALGRAIFAAKRWLL